MKTTIQKTERIHSLDSLRAIMMLLGLVIHSAIPYGVIDYGQHLKDVGATHLSNDLIMFFIHEFRMPIFFVIAGFFGAMLFYERTPLKMIKNRLSRIVYPFIVFLLVLWPIIMLTHSYSKSIFTGSNSELLKATSNLSNPLFFIPQMTLHLWFLYYLILITIVSVGLALMLKKLPVVSANIFKSFSWIIQKPILRVLAFTVLTCIVYLFLKTTIIEASLSFIPDINTFVFYFFFYIIGWVLFKSKHLLDSMMRLDWVCAILGSVIFMFCFVLQIIWQKTFSYEINILMNSLIVWLFIFGITGLFIRYASKYSLVMRYISDASYWVYLVHVPFTVIIPCLLFYYDIPATVKFLVVLISTTIICFVTYHYFVRATFIGKFLNGRKYPRSL